MDASTLPAHLNFLNDAAHILRASAPETSAYLMSRHNELMFLNGIAQTDVRRQHVCGACGHIMIAGQGTRLRQETEKAVKRKKYGTQASVAVKGKLPKAEDEARQRSGMRRLFTCGNCSRTTTISFPPPPPVVRRRAAVAKSMQVSSAKGHRQDAAAVEPAKPPTANASSKKRAKNRKAGLQALLNQAKASSSGGRSMSLADFAR